MHFLTFHDTLGINSVIDPIPTSLASLHPRSLGTGLTATPLIERVGMKISHGAVPASLCPTRYAIDVVKPLA